MSVGKHRAQSTRCKCHTSIPKARQETTTANKAKEQRWDTDPQARSLAAVTAPEAPEEAPGTSSLLKSLPPGTCNQHLSNQGRQEERLGRNGALRPVSYPVSANDQQLISREYLHTAPEQPALPSGCFAAGTVFSRGICRAHSGACWMQKQVLARFHSQALLPVRRTSPEGCYGPTGSASLPQAASDVSRNRSSHASWSPGLPSPLKVG